MNQVSIASAYMWAFVFMAVFFLLAVGVAGAISYKPNNPGTTARKISFWILGILSVVGGFVLNYVLAQDIIVPNIKSDYITNSCIAAAAALVVYVILGVVVSKLFPNSKVGTWF